MKSKREHTSLDKRMVFVQEIEESQFFVKIKRERPKEWNLGQKNKKSSYFLINRRLPHMANTKETMWGF